MTTTPWNTMNILHRVPDKFHQKRNTNKLALLPEESNKTFLLLLVLPLLQVRPEQVDKSIDFFYSPNEKEDIAFWFFASDYDLSCFVDGYVG